LFAYLKLLQKKTAPQKNVNKIPLNQLFMQNKNVKKVDNYTFFY